MEFPWHSFMKVSTQADYNNEIRQYFKEIDKYDSLPKEQEIVIGNKIKKGDFMARNELITSNLKFVVNVAKMYKGYGVPFGDLISEGNMGLIKAAEKYDSDKDVKFISYSVWWIKQYIQEFLRKNKNINDLEADSSAYVDNLNSYDNENESDEFYCNDPFMEEDDLTDFEDQDKTRKDVVNEIISTLNKRESDIIIKYFGLDKNKEMTLEEIGILYGLTKERVRQIKEKALRKLRRCVLTHPEFSKIQSLK